MDEKIFPKIGTQNLKNRVYELLLDLIISGKLKVGEMLPSERILAEELGVSRTVLREAIKSLETRGVLTVTHGKGIRVNPVDSSDISHAFMLYLRRQNQEVPLLDLIDFRSILEPEIAKRAAINSDNSNIKPLEEIMERMREAVGDMEQFNRIDLEYHLELAKLTNNIFLTTIMEELIIPIRESLVATGGIDVKEVFREHYKVFEQIREKSSDGAAQAMTHSLRRSQKLLEKHRNGK
jgi:GntR family transcriptional repressor for pyruvate dehydrogenase complex